MWAENREAAICRHHSPDSEKSRCGNCERNVCSRIKADSRKQCIINTLFCT